LDAVNRLPVKQVRCLWGSGKNAVASSDITKAPFVASFPDACELDPECDPTKLLPRLLDQLVILGQLAQQINNNLGGNGHRPEKLREVIPQLANERGTATTAVVQGEKSSSTLTLVASVSDIISYPVVYGSRFLV